jgi:DNA-binding NarL/FixJ family response regulator
VRTLVGRFLAGERLMDDAEVAELRAAWELDEEARRAAVQGVRSLSPRESHVLGLMHAGEPVNRIAERLEVSQSTVRSHVRAVLRKLGVKTQLAAVAEFETAAAEIDDLGGWPVER